MLSYRQYGARTKEGPCKKNLWSKNQIGNKKEGEQITRRNATGVPRHMRMPVGGIDWAVCQSWEPVPTIKFRGDNGGTP